MTFAHVIIYLLVAWTRSKVSHRPFKRPTSPTRSVRTIEESRGVESDFFHLRTGNFRLGPGLHQWAPGCDGSHHIRVEEKDSAHGRPRLEGCRTCAARIPSYWHTQQECQYVISRHCHGQMGLDAVRPHAGRCQGRLPQWCAKLLDACHDLHRWTPPISHVH